MATLTDREVLLEHHPVFSRFRQYAGVIPPGYIVDCLGTRTRNEYLAGLHAVNDCPYIRYTDGYSYPTPDNEDYFEWIDVLESVAEASGTYTMIDLGA